VLEHEIKYLVPASNAPALVAWTSSVCLRDEKHPPATVHTVYYDTPRLSLLLEKVDSDFLKTKVRVRWYADREGRPSEALFVEAKFRVGGRRRKVRHRLVVPAADAAHRPLHDRAWSEWLDPLRADVPYLPPGLAPMLGVRYVRHRFTEGADGARVTIDEGIGLDRVNTSRVHGRIAGVFPHAVFEYKGRLADPPPALLPVVRFGARRGSSSKYLASYLHLTRTTL
jgi:VTC domain-containing protein